MGSDAVIGAQVHQGNKWTGAGFTIAQHLGGLFVASKSLFTVDASENADFLPDFVNPLGWFNDVPTISTSYQCLPNNADCPIVQAASDYVREKEIATGQLTGLTYQAPQLWTAQRRLYERLIEEGNPYPSDGEITNFLTASQTNGIKDYADLQIGIRQMFQISTTDRSDLATYETQIAQGLDQLVQIEGHLSTPGLSQQDSISVAALRNATKQSLASLNTLRDTKLNDLANAQLSTANTLFTQNNGLSGTGDYMINEKRVNGIYLETVGAGNAAYSSTQLTYLQAIAAQCPLSGGEAVLRARDMLALSQDSPIFYDDATICGSALRQPSQDRTDQVLESDFVQVRPNPASESITINYSLSDGLEHKLVLMNAIGEIVTNFLWNGKARETTHSIGNLPPGIYWYTVIGGNGSETSGKLIINR